MITRESTLREIYSTAIGHDALEKVFLQLGAKEDILNNPIIGNLKLKNINKILGKKVPDSFYDAMIDLCNIETSNVIPSREPFKEEWWKEAVFYQIYPRTFCDSNDDGIGDLKGIISKLDYLKDLGVNALWLSPIYDSPNDDNGYDIRNYYEIMHEFGTMEDFDELLLEAHKRDIKLIMDLVVNHTSDEHEWFKEALKNPDSIYRKYYYILEGEEVRRKQLDKADSGYELSYDDIMSNKIPPNNWTSFFSGSAWNYYEKEDVWALHLFSKKQMDLNWECEELREDVYKMINFWLDKGVDGFRMDVINYISKVQGLPDGDETIGSLMGFMGIEKYYYGPRLNEFLQEMISKTFKLHNAFSVGEGPGLGMEEARLITANEREELNMIFTFDQLETPGHERWDDYEYDLNYYRDYMVDWHENYGSQCWMSLFYNNHDNPKMVSKVSANKEEAQSIEKLLAVMQFTLRGTPFIYQGDEMGLTNYDFTSMDEITDVEANNYYDEKVSEGKNPEDVFKIILAGTREHGRVLLPWNKKIPAYHQHVSQQPREEITKLYQELIKLRKENKAFIYGDFNLILDTKDRFVYERVLNRDRFIVDLNLGRKIRKAYNIDEDIEIVYSSDCDSFQNELGAIYKKELRAYEARIYKIK